MLLNSTTVFDDELVVGQDRDWFFRGTADLVTDLDPRVEETVTPLS